MWWYFMIEVTKWQPGCQANSCAIPRRPNLDQTQRLWSWSVRDAKSWVEMIFLILKIESDVIVWNRSWDTYNSWIAYKYIKSLIRFCRMPFSFLFLWYVYWDAPIVNDYLCHEWKIIHVDFHFFGRGHRAEQQRILVFCKVLFPLPLTTLDSYFKGLSRRPMGYIKKNIKTVFDFE